MKNKRMEKFIVLTFLTGIFFMFAFVSTNIEKYNPIFDKNSNIMIPKSNVFQDLSIDTITENNSQFRQPDLFSISFQVIDGLNLTYVIKANSSLYYYGIINSTDDFIVISFNSSTFEIGFLKIQLFLFNSTLMLDDIDAIRTLYVMVEILPYKSFFDLSEPDFSFQFITSISLLLSSFIGIPLLLKKIGLNFGLFSFISSATLKLPASIVQTDKKIFSPREIKKLKRVVVKEKKKVIDINALSDLAFFKSF